MDERFLTIETASGVNTITLDRPETLNSFNRPMAEQLQHALAAAADDEAVRAVLITGAGRGFCAGQDLAAVVGSDGQIERDLGAVVRECYNPLIVALRTLAKPVVAAVNGVAAGAGANLAMACDLVIASTSASFVQAFSKIGLIPDSGGTFLLPRLVGYGRASALMMLGEKLSASDAASIGMIYKAVAPEELLPEARRIAAQLAAMPTRGLALTKRALNESAGHSLLQQLDLEAALQRQAGQTEDFREGVAAFLAKRPAQFKGR